MQPYQYVVNNPVLLTDPSGEINPLLLLGLAGGIIGGGIYGYGSQVVHNLNQGMCFWDALTTDISAGQIALYTGAGALIGLGMGLGSMGVQAITTYFAAKSAVGIAVTGGAALGADGDPTNEVRTAITIGQKAIETVTSSAKIASQLQSKANILNIKPNGDMGNLSNPVVQTTLNRLNSICSSSTCRIWSGTWMKNPVYEYIDEGIGVVRSQATGALISITERVGPHLQKLQDFVDNGTATWLR